MRTRTLFLAAALLAALAAAPEAQAWGAYHVGYTHVGPGGAYHYGRTTAVGPYGAYSAGHVGGYGAYGGAYRYGYHYNYGGGPYTGTVHYAYHYGGYPYGGYSASGMRIGYYRGW
jgi:hypothetical protein